MGFFDLIDIFADKLDSDTRQPVFTFDVAQATYGILMPNPMFWLQLIAFMVLEAAFGASISSITYTLVIKQRGTAQAYLVGFGIIIPLCVYAPYLAIDSFGVRNMIMKFCLATIVPVLTIFHTTEAMFGFSPPCVEKSLGRYALYSASPMEVMFDSEKSAPLRVTMRESLHSVRNFGAWILALGLYKSILAPTGYEPFQTRLPLGSVDHKLGDLFNPYHLLNNFFAALLLQLYLTAFCSGLVAITNLVVGVRTKQVMLNPLFESTSPSDFWGRRWNTLIHGVLKRGVFLPVRRYFSKPVAATAAFLASGVFHEWILSAIFFVHDDEKDENGLCTTCYHPAYGKNLIFFSFNAAIIALEYVISGHYIFQWIKETLPKPLVAMLVVSTALPVAHLFTADYIKSGYFTHGQLGFPMIVRVT